MEIVFVKRDTAVWDFMWLWLGLHSIDALLENPIIAENKGEVWQYMGSYRYNDKTVHDFRHRLHPVTNDRYLASVNASDTFNDDQIEKIVKIN